MRTSPIQLSVTHSDYPLIGSSVADLARGLALFGPNVGGTRHAAATRWQLSWSYAAAARRDGFVLRDVALELSARVELPSWRAPSHASPELTAGFARYREGLRRHERAHVAAAMLAARSLRRALCQLAPMPSIAALDERVTELGDAAVAHGRALERALDDRSRHGVSELPEAAWFRLPTKPAAPPPAPPKRVEACCQACADAHQGGLR